MYRNTCWLMMCISAGVVVPGGGVRSSQRVSLLARIDDADLEGVETGIRNVQWYDHAANGDLLLGGEAVVGAALTVSDAAQPRARPPQTAQPREHRQYLVETTPNHSANPTKKDTTLEADHPTIAYDLRPNYSGIQPTYTNPGKIGYYPIPQSRPNYRIELRPNYLQAKSQNYEESRAPNRIASTSRPALAQTSAASSRVYSFPPANGEKSNFVIDEKLQNAEEFQRLNLAIEHAENAHKAALEQAVRYTPAIYKKAPHTHSNPAQYSVPSGAVDSPSVKEPRAEQLVERQQDAAVRPDGGNNNQDDREQAMDLIKRRLPPPADGLAYTQEEFFALLAAGHAVSAVPVRRVSVARPQRRLRPIALPSRGFYSQPLTKSNQS